MLPFVARVSLGAWDGIGKCGAQADGGCKPGNSQWSLRSAIGFRPLPELESAFGLEELVPTA
jgi:hypothetical protein